MLPRSFFKKKFTHMVNRKKNKIDPEEDWDFEGEAMVKDML